jgi:hypothetical protein
VRIETSDLHTLTEAEYDEELGVFKLTLVCSLAQLDARSLKAHEFTPVEIELQRVVERTGAGPEVEVHG